MRFYTKEWYELLQKQHYTSGLRKIPDREYTDEEIRAFYDKELKAEIARDRRCYDTPPYYGWAERLLQPENFRPENFLIEKEKTGELFHPATLEEAREYIDNERRKREEAFLNRPPFDPTETIKCFEECYAMGIRYGALHYPDWVRECVDPRLIALNRMPESAYKRLKSEERANKRTLEKIEKAVAEVLGRQDIPEEIRKGFCFHDAHVLRIEKKRSDVELYLKKDGLWPDSTPYIKVIFRNVIMLEREKGFRIRLKQDKAGEWSSSCQYLYDEIYHTDAGYEVHMMFWTRQDLRYMTVECEEIRFEDGIIFT